MDDTRKNESIKNYILYGALQADAEQIKKYENCLLNDQIIGNQSLAPINAELINADSFDAQLLLLFIAICMGYNLKGDE